MKSNYDIGNAGILKILLTEFTFFPFLGVNSKDIKSK